MKKNVFTSLVCIIVLLFSMSTPVLANSGDSNGIKLIGGIKQLNTFYNGDYIRSSDFLVDGYFVDGNNNTLDSKTVNISFQDKALVSNPTVTYYITSDEIDGIASTGSFDIEVLPFDPTVNHSEIVVDQMTLTTSDEYFTNIEYRSNAVKSYIGRNIESQRYTNNLGKLLTIDQSKTIVDTSSLKSEVGTYTIPYEYYFYPINLIKANQYNAISGTFEVSVINRVVNVEESPTVTPTATPVTTDEIVNPSLTANKLIFDSIGMAYDININNKPDDTVSYNWTSSSPSVATVNSKSGLVTAKAKGEATISCSMTDSEGTARMLSCDVIIGSSDDDLPVLSDTSLDLSVEDAFDLDVANKITGSKYRYKSSDSDIVTVKTLTGKGIAISEGTASISITITTPDNTVIIRKCEVTVSE